VWCAVVWCTVLCCTALYCTTIMTYNTCSSDLPVLHLDWHVRRLKKEGFVLLDLSVASKGSLFQEKVLRSLDIFYCFIAFLIIYTHIYFLINLFIYLCFSFCFVIFKFRTIFNFFIVLRFSVGRDEKLPFHRFSVGDSVRVSLTRYLRYPILLSDVIEWDKLLYCSLDNVIRYDCFILRLYACFFLFFSSFSFSFSSLCALCFFLPLIFILFSLFIFLLHSTIFIFVCFVLFYFILFYFILFYFILFYFVLFFILRP
jgi:hypothetical protein